MSLAKDKRVEVSPWVKAFAGSIGGAVEAVALQPLDVVKTRLQLDSTQRYKGGFLRCGVTIFQEEGPKALYKGLTPFVAHLMAKYALRMGSFSVFTALLSNDSKPAAGAPNHKRLSGEEEARRNFLAGLCAGMVEAVLVVTPFEVVKTRLQQQVGFKEIKYRGPVHAAATMVREEGVTALWKGVVPTMARNGTNQACNFMVINIFNRYIWQKEEGKQLAVWKTILSGSIAGALGPILNCPMDVLKTRFMGQHTKPGEAPKYKGVVSAIGIIVREEGLFALWKGLTPRLLRLAPGQAIMWTVVTRITTYFEQMQMR
ncbi:Mitochondrial succinate-fumarate transporter [Balamuthia mandrillaris]